MTEIDPIIIGKINYFCRERYYCHMENAASEGLQKYRRVQEGIRELDLLKDKRDVNLCSIMCLMLAHKMSSGLYYAGLFLFHTGKYDKAREYVDRMLNMAVTKEGLILKGWVELMSGREAKKAIKFFEDAIANEGSRDIDALFGKAKYLEMRHNYSGALELVNQVIVGYPTFIPALVEKMKLQLALQDWEQTIETAQRALNQDIHCIEAIRYQALHLVCREGNYSEASSKIGDLITTLDRFEPRSAFLYYSMAQGLCRLCGRNALVLQQTYTLMERCVQQDPDNAEYVNELGFQLLLQGKIKEAMKCIIHCQLLENQLDDAAQQLEFLNEIQQSIGKSAELSYLTAVLAIKRHQGPDKAIQLLNEAIEIHFANLKGLPLGTRYYLLLNPDFLLQVIKDYLPFGPQVPVTAGQAVNPVLKRCHQVLDPLTRAVPGLLEALFLISKVKYLAGDIDAAQGMLNHCLEVESTYSDAHILMAQIYLHQGNFKLANQSLEVGLSYNFEVRDHPLYHLIKARILKKQGELAEAVKTLQTAMTLPGKGAPVRKVKAQDISVNDRVSVFLELAEAHRLLGEQHEAAKVMQDAINAFQNSPEEVRITIANAELSLARGDVEMALGMLRNVTPEQPYYVEAREKMADIYLHHRKDKRLYASCYRELVEKHPSTQTCLLLGDAYMSIQEPEKAIEVYESALKKNPRDAALASKIGQALVKTHNYGKAINYYEAALKSGGQSFLRHDLAELLIKLRQYDKAEKVLKSALEDDSHTMIEQARYMVLLAKTYQKVEKLEEAMEFFTKARDMQASICVKMAEQVCNQRDYEKAIKFYKEALVYNENDSKLMTLLKNEKENDAATIMLADLMFRKNEYDSAMFHFQQLLQIKPDHYEALSRLVDLTRRAGKLEEVPKALELAENASPRASVEAGFNYCKGLYTGNPTAALKSFNKARKDSDWGNLSIFNMIEICLNPDNDTVGGEVFESVEGEAVTMDRDKADSEQMAVRTAEKLLKEIKPKPGDIRPKLLENMALLATKQKQNVEKALNAFMEITSNEREHVGALYGMAAAYMVLKQTPRARNQLKRVSKNNWTIQDGEDLEKSWLLLADIYIQSAKYDMATELLKKCLQHNKSCCKAYEYMGYIMEKEQSYKDAAMNYENAWKYGNKNNPVIGYKLAFNYLKARRFVDAIDICHHKVKTNFIYEFVGLDFVAHVDINKKIPLMNPISNE
ncbi:hypothetical protein KUTeg_014980 [Tegillarca granosa]|uniref:Tetratricopeptide repeat protein 21B n=1 Tax=Tegillarca granosa TaxID=220873 RepID=A0ABQ9ESF0_TEGGR|nr:hypothetical protein KUTeg_014980 [Tegillarca granosa]